MASFLTRITKCCCGFGRAIEELRQLLHPSLAVCEGATKQFAGQCQTVSRRDFHVDSGMKFLIASFDRSIQENTPVPIPYRQILLTARIMDAIFDQLQDQVSSRTSTERDFPPHRPPEMAVPAMKS